VDPQVTLINWLATAAMSLGIVTFGWATRDVANEYAKQSLVTLFFVPLIATSLYLMMAMGQGSTTLADGREVAWIRYVTWLTTTPLLLNQIARVVHAPPSAVASLVLADLFMIATGALAELSPMPQRGVWYAVSTVAFLFILRVLVVDLGRAAARCPDDVRRLYRTLLVVNVVTWAAYPLVWLFGPPGLRWYGAPGQALGFALLDWTSKVGFGLLIVGRRGVLERSGALAETLAARPAERPVTTR
jgi:bacteriorhodopsin